MLLVTIPQTGAILLMLINLETRQLILTTGLD